MPYGFDYYQFDVGRFDEVLVAFGVGDTAGVADAIMTNSKLKQSETVSVLDALANKIKALSGDNLAVLDDASRKMFVQYAETLSLLDSAMKLHKVLIAEDISTVEAPGLRTFRAFADNLLVREEQNLGENISIFAEDLSECFGHIDGNPLLSNGQNVLHMGGNWRAAMHYSEESAYCEVRTDGNFLGSNYLRIMDDITHTWKAFVGQTTMNLTKGKWYRVSLYARSSVTRGSYVYGVYNGSTETRLNKVISWGSTGLGPDKGWVRGEVIFQCPEDAASVSVKPYLYGHTNNNGVVAEVDYCGYRLEEFDSQPMNLIDSGTAEIIKVMSDSVTYVDAIGSAIYAYRSDLLSLADALSCSADASRADVLTILDGIASSIARGSTDEALAMAEQLYRKVGAADDLLNDIEPFRADFSVDSPHAIRTRKSTACTTTVVDDDTCIAGKALKVNGYYWGAYNVKIPYNPDMLYKMKVRVKQLKYNMLGTSTFYAGVEGIAADGTTFINASGANSWSSQHYIAGSGITLPLNEWKEYTGYFKGNASSNTQGLHSNPNNPAQLYTGVCYFNPMFIFNYSGDIDGEVLMDYQIVSYSMPVIEEIFLKAGKTLDDTLSPTEALVALVGKSVFELSDALDDIKAKVKDSNSDNTGATDAVGAKITKIFDDTIAIADTISRVMRYAVPSRALFDIALLDVGLFDENTGSEHTAMADDIIVALTIRRLLDDVANLADEIGKSIGKAAADTGNVNDAVFAATDILKGDSIGIVDASNLNVASKFADVMGIASMIASRAALFHGDSATVDDGCILDLKMLSAELIATADWGAAKIGSYLAEVLSLGDEKVASIGAIAQDTALLVDWLSKALNMPQSDAVGLAYVISAAIGISKNDGVGIGDGANLDVNSKLADAMGIVSAIASKASAVIGDSMALDDRYALGLKMLSVELLSISEAGSAKIGSYLAEVLSLSDEHVAMVGALAQDTASLTDEIATALGLSKGDAVELAYAISAATSISKDDNVGMVDAIERVFRYMLAGTFDYAIFGGDAFDGDGVMTVDDMAIRVCAKLADVLGISDDIAGFFKGEIPDVSAAIDSINAKIGSIMGDALGVSDELAQAIARLSKAEAMSMLDSIVNSAGSAGNNDSSSAIDSIEASLSMLRAYSDMVSMADALRLHFESIVDDMLLVSDSAYFAMKAARQEALNIADALGLSLERPLSGDMVGVIDEKYIRALAGFDELPQELADRIEGRKIRVLQQVFIQGVQVPVTGLTIHHSANSRISTCTFNIHSPSARVLSLSRQGADVKVYMADGEGTTDYFAGRIVGNPVTSRSTIANEISITVDDYTGASNDVYVSEVYTETDGTLTDILKDLWGKYYGYDIDLSQVIATTKTADIIVFNYDTLFDSTEKIAQLLGWVWFVAWGPSGLSLQFYPPSSAIKPVVLSRENRNISAGSLRFGQGETIINSVYIFGGEEKSEAYTDKQLSDGQKTEYTLQYKPYRLNDTDTGGVSVIVGGIAMAVGVQYLHDAEDFDVLVNFNDKRLIFREDNKPAKDMVIETIYSYGYPILVHLTNEDSIRQFGIRERKIHDTSIRSVKAAREYGRSILRDSAMPKGYGSCEVFVEGLRAGDFVTVDLPAYNVRGLFEIAEIKKWIAGNTIKRAVSLNIADNAENRIAQRLKEFAKRLKKLETAQASENLTLQRLVSNAKNIAVLAPGTAKGSIYENAGSGVTTSEAQLFIHKQLERADVYVRGNAAACMDSVVAKAKLAKADLVIGHEKVVMGMTFFDKSIFGSNAGFGQEVVS